MKEIEITAEDFGLQECEQSYEIIDLIGTDIGFNASTSIYYIASTSSSTTSNTLYYSPITYYSNW